MSKGLTYLDKRSEQTTKRITIAGEINKIKRDTINEFEILKKLIVLFPNKDKDYLRKRIKIHISWLKKEGRI